MPMGTPKPPALGQPIIGPWPSAADEPTHPNSEVPPSPDSASDLPPAYLIDLATEPGELHALTDHFITLGRDRAATIHLPDLRISRAHANLIRRDSAWWLADLNSHNGTFKNGRRLVEAERLADGDVVGLGEVVRLKFTCNLDVEEALHRSRLVRIGPLDATTRTLSTQLFYDRIHGETAFAKRHNFPLSLLFVDVLGFRALNDAHGRPFGDYVLCELASLMRKALRVEDFLCRWFDDKFLILCRGTSGEQALVLASRLANMVASHSLRTAGVDISATITVGIASMPDPRHTSAELLFMGALDALLTARGAGHTVHRRSV